ncbi:hypothetical protein SR870_23195 [Rhodopseudomonas palustris]|uniref:hypothetical protein n=1 Tax=Rhodopseudomonas palustris TaxID=1076 RepID=UPI002ACE77B3|nr:hypothetical protein [Rhodopseudomonas palustris]WQG99539.1 hypothetical protein SR870_23195 [Rhodopseudomonas palustris]
MRLWLKAAICLCALAVVIVATGPVASAHDAPRGLLEFVKTPPPCPTPHGGDEPEVFAPEAGAHLLAPAALRSGVRDRSTRLRLPLAGVMLDRSERPLLRPPIAS